MADETPGGVTIEDVEDIVRRRFGGLVDEAIAMLTVERLRPELEARMIEVKTERDAEIDILETRLKAYTDQQIREWDKHQQARVTDALAQIDEITERMRKLADATEDRISSHENRVRDTLRTYERRIMVVENGATARDQQIAAIEANIDKLLIATTKNTAAATANARAIELQQAEQAELEERLEEAVKRNNELHDKIDKIHDYMRAQAERQERWRRLGRRALDFLGSSAGRKVMISATAALTAAVGHAEGVWADFIDRLKSLF